jgi:hypothetical protein
MAHPLLKCKRPVFSKKNLHWGRPTDYNDSVTKESKERPMSKKSLLFIAVLLFLAAVPFFAQDQGYQKRNAYTKTFPIERIYTCRYGYMVAYRNATYDLREIYISNKNFTTGQNSKAVIVYGRGPEYPYLSVTWIEGKIDHTTIYAVDGGSENYVLHGTDDELKAKFPDDFEIKF